MKDKILLGEVYTLVNNNMEDEDYYNSNVPLMTILDKGKSLFVALFMNSLKTSFVASG